MKENKNKKKTLEGSGNPIINKKHLVNLLLFFFVFFKEECEPDDIYSLQQKSQMISSFESVKSIELTQHLFKSEFIQLWLIQGNAESERDRQREEERDRPKSI